jgi:hypothetical protein
MAGRRSKDAGGVTRRRLLGGAALGAAGVATGGLRTPALAKPPPVAHEILGDPKPTTAGLVGPAGVGWHLGSVGVGAPNSSIFDFDGVVAGADIRGPGKLYPSGDLHDEANAIPIEFDADVRLMKGRYTDRGGRERRGAFAFI